MKALGLRPVRFPGKEDCHPRKGYVNWWENDMNDIGNKAYEKQKARKEILNELRDMINGD